MPFKDAEERRRRQREYDQRFLSKPGNREKKRRQTKETRLRTRKMVRELLSVFFEDGCCVCGEKDPVCLQAHHVDPKTKRFNVGDYTRLGMGPTSVSEELKKCVCLCANCHRKEHAGKLKVRLRAVA